ncbi:MAG: hypothetical protein MRJ96_13440 [Nitrospirales bacterium]|nr:hypothetical protein [Nitrospira sp.]MDR4502448.1 hypothetical protein [Nitrospirales bacterium]
MPDTLSQKRERTITRGIAKAERLLTHGVQTSTSFTRCRLAIFLLAFFTCLALYKAAWFHTGNLALLAFLALFATVTYFHGILKTKLLRLTKWKQQKVTNLARLQLDWSKIPSRSFPTIAHHSYAYDLDIVGPHSLLQLLDSTLSLPGQQRLRQWILAQNEHPLHDVEWTHRQSLIQEISGLTLLRDRIALEASLVSEQPLDGQRIEELLRHGVSIPYVTQRLILALILCVSTIILGILSVSISIPGYWVLSFGLYVALYFYTAGHMTPIFGRALDLHHELEKFVAVTQRLERHRFFDQPELKELCAPLITDRRKPSKLLRDLARVCAGLSIKAHPLVHLFVNALMPWDLSFVYQLKKTCHRLEHSLPIWIDRLATLDASSSIGTFAYLNPDYTWPAREQLSASQSEAGFTATNIGHPLIKTNFRVENSLALHGLGHVLLVTGSNMSGKSTFLRTIGINICLAQAGAPVCADYLAWTWLRLLCCIRVTDSLAEGLSYFYAEVKRLKVVLDGVNEREGHPVLFLIDEIYKGTNNRERLGGSEAFIKALQKGNGLGLLSTHDLELALLETNGSRIHNMHFQETIENGKLQFDYQLKPGPCPTTNALRIMAQEGLPVPDKQTEDIV